MSETTAYKLTDEQRRLVEDNMGIVVFALTREYGASYAYDDDNIAEGLYALCRAAARFDASRGFKFSGYAYSAVINRMRSLAKRRNNAAHKLDKPIMSLDANINGHGRTLTDVIPDGQPDPDVIVCRAAQLAEFRALLDDIRTEAPILVEHIDGIDGIGLAPTRGMSGRAAHEQMTRQRRRIRRKYAKRYRRIKHG